jgi:hypothetical protein
MGRHFRIASEAESAYRDRRIRWRLLCGAKLLTIAVLCPAALAGVFAEAVQSAEFQTLSREQIVGRDAGTRTAFSAESRGARVEIRIDLPNRKSILAVVDYETESLALKSVATGTDQPAKIDAADVARIKALGVSIGRPGHQIGDTLSILLELMSEAPAGVVVDVDTNRKQGPTLRGYESLCGVRNATGHYDVDGTDFTVPVTGLGCYTGGNKCLGRCGANCGDTPFGNVAAVQRITQECLDHDLCAHATGENLGPCFDEWNAAADGFFFAPDCASLTDTWRDGTGGAMRLTQDDDQDLTGRIATNFGECRYRVRAGEHIEQEFRLSTRVIDSTPGCCPRLIYHGSIARSCNAARVTWRNSCGDEGAALFDRE